MTRAALLRISEALKVIFPHDKWRLHLTEPKLIAQDAGISLTHAEIAPLENGLQFKLLIDAKRESREISLLDNALTWREHGLLPSEATE